LVHVGKLGIYIVLVRVSLPCGMPVAYTILCLKREKFEITDKGRLATGKSDNRALTKQLMKTICERALDYTAPGKSKGVLLFLGVFFVRRKTA